jgi:hypothetical protein
MHNRPETTCRKASDTVVVLDDSTDKLRRPEPLLSCSSETLHSQCLKLQQLECFRTFSSALKLSATAAGEVAALLLVQRLCQVA